MRTYTMQEITSTLGDFTYTLEDMQRVHNTLQGQFNQENTAELVCDIMKHTEEKAAENSPQELEEVKSWNPTERLLWIVKEAYIAGFLDGTKTTLDAGRLSLEKLEGIA